MPVCKYLFAALFLMLSVAGYAQTSQSVTFHNLGNKTGSLYIGWYNNSADFREPSKAVFQKKVAVNKVNSVTVSFDNVKPGTYALAVFFDENGNGKLDTNFFGIPKEKYGFSNNVFPLTRAATFKEAAFQVADRNLGLQVRLK